MPNITFYSKEAIVEALMYHTSVTSRVLDLVGVKVDNPVLYTGGASESDNYCVQLCGVPCVAENIQNGVTENLGLKVMIMKVRIGV